MSMTRFLAQNGVEAFLARLSSVAQRVLVPVERPAASKPSVVFAPWQKGKPFTLAKATVPPKEAVLPECETLFTFHADKEGPDVSRLVLEEPQAMETAVIFACRPCDAQGLASIDRPYMQGLFKDPYYAARREKLTVVTHTCASGCQTCFCHWVGGGPSCPEGSDVLMTPVADGFVLEAITPKGEELLGASDLPDGSDREEEMRQTRERAQESLTPAPDISASPASLRAMFADEGFWEKQTDRCISCGACTYFCPSCYCFNITDEGEAQSEKGGRRLRSWDNCMSSRYTREASGHNPRPHKSQRMRNRVSHKFWTYVDNWGAYLCSGCGRCIANCPVHLDIRAIVLAALHAAK